MNQAPLPIPPSSEACPVDANERLVLLDVLRGFALCGVFVANVLMWFSGRAYFSRAQMEAAIASMSRLDIAAMHGVSTLVFGKFMTLFSFLFGLGFSVQLLRAEARGASITPLYVRRLCAMLLIGIVHLAGLWYGDILAIYATLGFALLLFRQRSDKVVLAWAAVLILVMPLAMASLGSMGAPPAGSAEAKAAVEHTDQIRAWTQEAFTNGTYVEVVRANVGFYLGVFIEKLPAVLFALLGRFLLGYLAGRRRLFHDVPRHLPFFRKLLGWGLLTGGFAIGAGRLVQYLIRHETLDPRAPWLPLMNQTMRQLNELGVAAFYAAGLVLLFQRPVWQRLLLVLAPAGRMALTNYLSQTMLSLLMYDGFGLGLIGKLGPTVTIGLTLAVFSGQVAFSHWWLARFRFGPAEWVWRSLTYGKAQPMRQGSPIASAAAPTA